VGMIEHIDDEKDQERHLQTLHKTQLVSLSEDLLKKSRHTYIDFSGSGQLNKI